MIILFLILFQMEHARSIIFNVNGQNMLIKGVTQYTTCDDVIEIVFYNYLVNTDSYALFESSLGVERMLYGKESVLKVVRSWGADLNNFTLLVRKVDNVRSNMATVSLARRKLHKIRLLNMKHLSSKVHNRTIQANLNNSCDKTMNAKDIENITPTIEKDKHSKLVVLKRFMSDVMLQKRRQTITQSRSRLGNRTPADGCYGNVEQNGRKSAEGVEQEKEFLRRHNSYLNAAFVECDDTTKNDTSDNDNIDSDDESDFEDDIISELERNICDMSESDNESYSSDTDGPFCDSDNTVVKCERIIDMFRKAELSDDDSETEDDHMESFMNTFVYNSDPDEEMGSVESDAE